MKRYLLPLLILCAIAVSAQELDDILTADSAKLNVNISSEFEVVPEGYSYSLSFIEAKTSFFLMNTERQVLQRLDIIPQEYTLEEDMMVFEWRNPRETNYQYLIDGDIITSGRPVRVKKKIPFPREDEEFPEFVKATDNIDSDDEDIRELAQTLSAGKDDYYEVVLEMAEWVNHNINYNLSTLTAEVSQPASWVLDTKEGVCDEMTSLFIALLRAVDIPAKYVSGISYTNSPLFNYDFGAHGWADVYFPEYGWIPFDVTYGEYGYIDASHVALKKSKDSGETSTYYGWRGNNVRISSSQLQIDTQLLDLGEQLPSVFTISARPLYKEVGFGSYNIIEATIKNTQNYYAPTSIKLTRVQNMEILSKNPHFLLFRPDEVKKVYWIVQVNDKLSRRFSYTFPFNVYIPRRNMSDDSSFKVMDDYNIYTREQVERLRRQRQEEFRKSYSLETSFYCEAYKEIFYQNESPKIECSLHNLGNSTLGDVEVCVQENCTSLEVRPDRKGTVLIDVHVEEFGQEVFTVVARNREISKSDSVTVNYLRFPEIEIKNMEFPEAVGFDENFQIRFVISGKNNPVDLKVNLKVNKLSKTWRLDSLPTDREFIINMNSLDLYPRENNITIKVVYDDYGDRSYNVQRSYSLRMKNLSFLQKIYLYGKMFLEKTLQ